MSTRPRFHDSAYQSAIASRSRLGRIKLAVLRCFIVSEGQPITARAVLERAFPRLKRFTGFHRRSAWRALLMSAEIVGRNRFGRGRPNLWALKARHARDTE
jgi:hypothetical protein